MKHTPLPFHPVLETAHTSAEITDAKGRLIASFAVRPYRNRTNADVRLMASAPQLLAALSELLEQATGPAAIYGNGIGADGKKTGLSHWEFNALRDKRIENAHAAIALAEGRE